jgi:hypothetical protein
MERCALWLFHQGVNVCPQLKQQPNRFLVPLSSGHVKCGPRSSLWQIPYVQTAEDSFLLRQKTDFTHVSNAGGLCNLPAYASSARTVGYAVRVEEVYDGKLHRAVNVGNVSEISFLLK